MKLKELDRQLAESLEEGPLDWMWHSSKLGQWWDSRKGKAQQRDIAVLLVQIFSKWRGFNSVKEITPKNLATWLASNDGQYGLGLPAETAKAVMLKTAKTSFGPGVKANTPLNGSQVKNFISNISRLPELFPDDEKDPADSPTVAPTPAQGQQPRVVPGGQAAAQSGASVAS